MDFNDLNLALFEPLVGETFQMRSPEGQEAEFVLVEASDLSERMKLPEHYRTPFALLFRPTDEDLVWPQGMYELTHEKAQGSLFFAAVIDPERPGRPAYEATFS